jgi:signal peptidase II
MSSKNKTIGLVAIVIGVLIIDQALKIWIKTHFALGESVSITGWFQLLFVENPGMAFGMELGGKLFLTLFRVVASGAIIYYLTKLIKQQYQFGFIACIGLILAGAVGNLIDSVFYGRIFSHSYGQLATIFPHEGGYAPYFYGKVVDMFYFPLIKDGMGETIFFKPVFNFADSAVTVGVALVLIFYRKELNKSLESKSKKNNENEKA